MTEPIEKIKTYDIDTEGNNNNFWVLLDKINELVDRVNKIEEAIQK